MTPAERINAMLSDGRAINMILTYQSRTGIKRGYRLFALDPSDHRTTDITADICRIIGKEWNHDRGTFDSTEPYRSQDQHELARALSRALDRDTLLTVLVL